MTFLAPLTLIALMLIALPLAIHLLVRRRAKRLDFPSLRFLRETSTFKFRPRRLRQPLLLALRVFALLLLVAGLARPLITYRGRRPLTRVILLDTSLSMRAGGRAEAATQQARAIIERLGKDERAALIAFSAEAIVLVSPTSDRQQLEAALQRYVPDAAAADYANGLAAAEALLAAEPPGPAEIDLVSDFQQSGLMVQSSSAREKSLATIATYPVGGELRENSFLIDVSAARTSKGIELSASEVASDQRGRAGERRKWLLNSPAGELPEITWRTESNGQIVGSLNPVATDDIQLDNRHFFSFVPPLGARVLLVSNGDADVDVYWQAALEAAAGKDSKFTLEKVQDLQGASATDYGLIVATLSRSPDRNEIRRLVELAEHGATVWLNLAPDTDAKSWNDFAGSAEGSKLPFTNLGPASGNAPVHFATADMGAPFLRSFDQNAFDALRTTNHKKAFSFTPRDEAGSLLRWNNGQAALVWQQVGAGQILVLGTSPGLQSGDLGLSPAFPVLVGSMADSAISTPAPLSQELGKPVASINSSGTVTITDPAGIVKNKTARDLAAHPQSAFSNPGIYRVEAGGQVRFLAFNFPPEESDRLVARPQEVRDRFASRTKQGVVSGSTWHEATESAGSQWRYFLGLAFLLLMLELFLVIKPGRSMSRSDAL
ncbi:MAG: VWA domain-containing protein [Pyrinomonadaceae bacterium]